MNKQNETPGWTTVCYQHKPSCKAFPCLVRYQKEYYDYKYNRKYTPNFFVVISKAENHVNTANTTATNFAKLSNSASKDKAKLLPTDFVTHQNSDYS